MSEIWKLTLKEVKDLLHNGEVSPLTLVHEMFERIESQSHLNNFITITRERAFKSAEESWERIKQGNARALEGIPIGVKDLYCVKNERMTSASNVLRDFIAPYESHVTQKLWNQGAICLGKLNMDEFAMGSSNNTSAFGPSFNPWNYDQKLSPGGSSGGSASAVASGSCFAALGSDTGGSVRQPASFCGIVGFKPSYGRCSRFGMTAYASSFDQAGVFARNVEDTAIMMNNMMGYDPKDSMSCSEKPPTLDINKSIKGKVFAYPKNWMENLDKHIIKNWENCLQYLRDAGAIVKPIELMDFDFYLSTYYLLTTSEAASNLSRYTGVCYGSKKQESNPKYNATFELFGKEVKRRILMGVHSLSSKNECGYKLGLKARSIIKNDFMKIFEEFDAIVYPCSPREAFPVNKVFENPTESYKEDVFTVIPNLIGSPAMSVPSGYGGNGLPIGIHLMSKPFDEQILISTAIEIEKRANFVNYIKKFENDMNENNNSKSENSNLSNKTDSQYKKDVK
ncbi:Asp-tRNA(Asn)/Glu-tRNA(Gln) amidotransferase subunit GatA [Candidatus Nesciobacter abundans]|uniref:Glutamyl-tRNA(Gln) amidotransferase subunit A n=1 Tax=Candidatus Nesciobacter abundans TaxID=2601668 RepID=A0A5C0UHX9_9PROT|nr:Asp-tRNA(Asn)/Glu-tRNA(Gln) amidotransferase subunit GatA [Candidatus Nesciobacter abundans]QEK39183.1 Asp-tRNA(Asn)/Glu-tRNA(Gln) amidotransferase subunit GatA [Candidatus Nesciobacter abundans]